MLKRIFDDIDKIYINILARHFLTKAVKKIVLLMTMPSLED